MNGFDQFDPILPEGFRDSQDVFLGAACPAVQLKTLAQCTKPRWVVADTVDAWIETTRNDLETLLKQIDCLLINDSEVRQLSGIHNLVGAGKWLLTQGPGMVIIKKGEHGSIFLDQQSVVPFPAFPCENVVDPTGAGDSFAGGMMGYLANQENIERDSILRAIQIGTVMASFTIEDFSVDGLLRASRLDVEQRHKDFARNLA
jgi:sugar/nucleoside kinase (ribokinase family)